VLQAEDKGAVCPEDFDLGLVGRCEARG
jgi:hypothetical protein